MTQKPLPHTPGEQNLKKFNLVGLWVDHAPDNGLLDLIYWILAFPHPYPT